jgi:hypothetical protein
MPQLKLNQIARFSYPHIAAEFLLVLLLDLIKEWFMEVDLPIVITLELFERLQGLSFKHHRVAYNTKTGQRLNNTTYIFLYVLRHHLKKKTYLKTTPQRLASLTICVWRALKPRGCLCASSCDWTSHSGSSPPSCIAIPNLLSNKTRYRCNRTINKISRLITSNKSRYVY